MIIVQLPWPPTINTYWRRNGARYFISKKGQEYRKFVAHACALYKNTFSAADRLKVHIKAYPPDKRKRDLDNLFKSCLDSLQHAGIYSDDSQIDFLCIERMPDLYGEILVYIEKVQ